jgi:small-conductance mechanosensitive channel
MHLATEWPLWIRNVWTDWAPLIRIGLIVIAAIVLRAALQISIRRVVRSIESGVDGKARKRNADSSPVAKARVVQRARTMGSVLNNFITWSVAVFAVASILSELGVAVGALVAGAGVLGAAIGFGAQSLVRDLISGLFIVFEDQFGVGDFVDLGQANGVVEVVGLRVTQVRDINGVLWYVRNGEIIRVGNHSQGWSRVVLDVPLAYSANLDKARAAILKATTQVEKSFKSSLIGKAEIWGIETLTGEQVVLRLVQQVKPENQDEVARELRLQVKISLDASKVSLATTAAPIYVEVAGKAVK